MINKLCKLLGGQIDWGHHEGRAHVALSQTVVFAKAVQRARDLTNDGKLGREGDGKCRSGTAIALGSLQSVMDGLVLCFGQ